MRLVDVEAAPTEVKQINEFSQHAKIVPNFDDSLLVNNRRYVY